MVKLRNFVRLQNFIIKSYSMVKLRNFVRLQMGVAILFGITIFIVMGLHWKRSLRRVSPPCPACARPKRSCSVRLGLALWA